MNRQTLQLLGVLAVFSGVMFSPIAATAMAQEAPSEKLPADDPDAALLAADGAEIEEALNLIRNNKIDQGTLILERLAGKGNAAALFHMGELFRLGIGREKAVNVATMYYRLASTLGHERASLSLANILFFEGDGSEQTIAEALGVWQDLALSGNLESLYVLGMIYWNGDAGLEQDPVRGYGLVWRASKEGYDNAIQNELTMRSILNGDARRAAMEYGNSLQIKGFSAEPLAPELLVDQASTTTPPEAGGAERADATATAVDDAHNSAGQQIAEATQKAPPPSKPKAPLEKPEDWTTVWRLEVGFAMSKREVMRLQSVINRSQSQIIGPMFSEINPSATRPGLFRLVYGPISGMSKAVTTCVALKRAGHDCTVRAPEED